MHKMFAAGMVIASAAILILAYASFGQGSESATVEVSDVAGVDTQDQQDYGTREVTNADAAPQIVNMSLHQHDDGGYGLEVEVSNMIFEQWLAGSEHSDNHGHARIYIDNQPLDWLYGPSYDLGWLAPGIHTVRVELNTNDRQTYTVNGTKAGAELIVNAGVDGFVELLDGSVKAERADDKHSH